MNSPEIDEAPTPDEAVSDVRASWESPAAQFGHEVGPLHEWAERRERVARAPHWLLVLCIFTFSGCDSESASPSDRTPGAYVLSDSVDLRYSDRTDETIDAGDFFSDTTVVWSADQFGSGTTGFGDVHVTLPVNIEVTGGENVTLNVEDVFGDNQFTWQRLESLSDEAWRVGGEVEVDMPVVIRVSDSRAVLVDLEDVFGDNSFTWTVGTPAGADATLAVGQISGGVGGPFQISMSVTVEVVDSEDVEVDVEDVLNDSRFTWVGGDRGAAAFVGGPMRFEVPLTFRVERSERVRINLEDTAGDLTLDWIAGVGDSVGGPVRFDVPTTFDVVDSRDVNIDFEDQGGDNIFTWTVDGPEAGPTELTSSVAVRTPAEFRVVDSRGVKVNSEDFFGDNVFVWTGPFPSGARPGLDGSVSASASATFQVEVSDDVTIDAEDVYGDNLFAWEPTGLDQASPLPPSVYEVVGAVSRDVVESDSVTIEFANLNRGNRYLWGPPTGVDR